MALELNPQPWQAAAKRTPEAWDDAFFSMVLLAYDNVSARGWSNWQQRNWDYGGCSPFGNGEDLHLRILLAAGPLRKQNGIDGAATAIWNDTLRDILQPDGAGEFPYCEGQGGMTSQAKLKAEADKILAQAPLSDAERELVMARITAGFPGDRPE